MTDIIADITSEQVRAARSLLAWSQQDLATRAQVATSTLADFERGSRTPVPNNLLAIRSALEQAGVVFIEGGVRRGVRWTFVTEKSGGSLLITLEGEDPTSLREFAAIFGSIEGGAIKIATVQCASPELKSKLSEFVEKNGSSARHLYRIRQLLLGLQDGEFFLILPRESSSTAEEIEVRQLLHKLNHPEEETYDNEFRATFGDLLEKYNVKVAQTDKRNEIGPSRKSDRQCRFCHRTVRDGAIFKKEAHAIPTSIGNKLLKNNDECDECNEFFGRELEPDLTEILNIQRVFLGIEARGGRPNPHFEGGHMRHDGNLMVVASKQFSEDASGTLKINLGKGNREVVLQHFYRALAKIALSIIPDEHLPDLKETVDWVRYGTGADKPLPKIAAAIVPLPPNPSAQMTLYLRRVNDSHLPHVVGEFRLGCYLYVFALPFSKLDEWNLVEFFDDEEFKDTFRHYQPVSWKRQDYSNNQKKELVQTITMVPRNSMASGEPQVTGQPFAEG